MTDFDLLQCAHSLAIAVNSTISLDDKKIKGQYFTPPYIARLMAAMVTINRNHFRLLDPGAGLGILTCAFCERLMGIDSSFTLDVDLFEKDTALIPKLKEVMNRCQMISQQFNVKFSYRIINDDFILSNHHAIKDDSFTGIYDLVISNPPYFKLSKTSPYAVLMSEYVHGQPNIYFLFMAMAERLLKMNGQFVFITPRSYCSGQYFETFRKQFLYWMDPKQIHIFQSRKDTFNNEQVLQENTIMYAQKSLLKDKDIIISSSSNECDYSERIVPKSIVVDNVFEDNIIRIPTSKYEDNIVRLFDSWNNNLSQMGIQISTGPVVAFRSKEYLSDFDKHTCYPLLKMRNVGNLFVEFPTPHKNNQGILKTAPDSLIIPTRNYILLKRFSAKEQKKRVEASILLKSSFPSEKVGIENHLNYIYKIDGSLSDDETLGITAFLNTRLVDTYFRIINGNTQVNASDIRMLPLPDSRFLITLGSILKNNELRIEEVEEYCNRELVSIMSKLEQAKDILTSFKLPERQRNNRSAYTLLALLGIKKNDSWSKADKHLLRIHDIMEFIKIHYEKPYAENSRETIRRQTIHQFEQAAIVERNPDDPTRPTNSGLTVYAVTDEALEVIRKYGTDEWEEALQSFIDCNSTLVEKYARKRDVHKVPVRINKENFLMLSPGEHNVLQKAIIEEFGPIFAPGSQLLYLGDTEHKTLFIESELLEDLNIPVTQHDKLPDVVLFDTERIWLFLIEAVTSHRPMSPKRVHELEEMLQQCEVGVIFVSAFSSANDFKKYVTDIAWETEVWFADTPEHILHFNGDRFMGPRV
jgi:adenine-specific DNA-methyltransferase